MLILAFWNDKYYPIEQKEKTKEINRKVQLEENFNKNLWENKNPTAEWVDEDLNVDTLLEINPQKEEDPIKYIDPSQFK